MERGKLPCPVDEHGLPLIPEDFQFCYTECYFDQDEKSQNRHHLEHPRNDFRGSLERAFRETGTMVVKACICKHSDYHATYKPPKKPSKAVMHAVLMREIYPQEAPVFIRPREQ